jgi:hypothetical protein
MQTGCQSWLYKKCGTNAATTRIKRQQAKAIKQNAPV